MYVTIDLTTSKVVAVFQAKSLHAAKCYAAKHHYGRFHMTRAAAEDHHNQME